MFGKTKISPEEIQALQDACERDKAYREELAECRKTYEIGRSELDASRQQMETDIAQVRENEEALLADATANMEAAADLANVLNQYQERLSELQGQMGDLASLIASQQKESENLVEDNKYYTSASKYFGDLPLDLKSEYKAYGETLNYMKEYNKQMSVLALNAAIEAGRMGDSGKQFVASAEEIRVYMMNYDNAIRDLEDKLKKSENRVSELEEQVHKLVSNLKDSNVAAGKLMRSTVDTGRKAEKILHTDLTSDCEAACERAGQVVAKEENVIHTIERDCIFLQDVQAEYETQTDKLREMEEALLPTLDKAEGQGEGV